MSRAENDELMPVVGLRLMEGRVGSTLLMSLLASAPEIVCDRRHPVGENRYLSYFVRLANWIGTPFDPNRDVGVTEMFFGPNTGGGPLPWHTESLSVEALGSSALRGMWRACSAGFRARNPNALWYAEKLAYPIDAVIAAGIPLQVIDVVRDPRDVIASMIAFGDRSGPWGFGHTPGQSEADWIASLIDVFGERLDTMLAKERVPTTLLRYEDFATNLHGTAAMLGSMLELQFDADNARAAPPKGHITARSVEESIGRWRRDLAADLAERIWTSLSTRLEALGYAHD